ncbi:hypothetical protein [Deinococcus sonorensis]|uniref:Uncharacterized protein n=2 Tax=Deinococcus sonorensis TaxID=309891 RepID=A0AAU7U6P2_9DEIO
MFRPVISTTLALVLLAAPPVVTAGAQGVPPIVIRDQKMAQGALREVDQQLSAAVKRRSRDALLQAITHFQQTIDALATLEYQGLQDEVKKSRALYQQALGTLLEVMTVSCEHGSIADGLAAGDLLRALDVQAQQALGSRTVDALRVRVPACLKLELKIDSKITQSELKYVVHVDVRVPLTYNLNTGDYSGRGTVSNVEQALAPDGGCDHDLPFTPTSFTVQHLALQRSGDFVLSDVLLDRYDPAGGTELMKVTCPDSPQLTVPMMNWGLAFSTVRHLTGGLVVSGWRMGQPAGLVASKVIEQPVSQTFVEATDMVLVRAAAR